LLGGVDLLSGEGRNRLEKEIRTSMKGVFGKGPESIEITFGEKTIVIVIGGFLTKVEKLRMEKQGGIEGVRDFRYDEMKNEMEEIFNDKTYGDISFGNAYIDVHADKDSACLVLFVTKE